MGETSRLETRAAQDRKGGVLSGLRDGAVHVLEADGGDEPQVALRLDFARNAYYLLGLRDAAALGTILRSHAALAERALPWQPDEEPSGKPSKVRHGGWGQHGGWVQVWTPWPPPEPPQVWLICGETVVLSFAQAVDLAQALEDAAGRPPT